MSLSLAGALQQAAAAAQTAATAAGGGGGAGSAGAAAPHTLSSSLSQGSLQAASSVSSLAQLLDAGDVDMDSSSSAEDGEAAAEGDAGGMGPAAAKDAGEFAGLSDEAVAQWLQQRLEPSNPHMVKKFQASVFFSTNTAAAGRCGESRCAQLQPRRQGRPTACLAVLDANSSFSAIHRLLAEACRPAAARRAVASVPGDNQPAHRTDGTGRPGPHPGRSVCEGGGAAGERGERQVRGMKGPCCESRLGGANTSGGRAAAHAIGQAARVRRRRHELSAQMTSFCSRLPHPRRRKAGTAPPPPEALRRYQQQPVEALMAGRNVIHVAPTGSGKTAVAVAATLCMLQQDHSARIVFLAPSVALAEQQAGACMWGCVCGCTKLIVSAGLKGVQRAAPCCVAG